MKKTISCLLAGLLTIGSTAGAVSITSADVSWGTPRTMTITGRNDSGNKDEYITIQVLNPNVSMNDFSLTASGTAFFVHAAQVKTDEGGSFSYSFDMENATSLSGDFTVRVNSNKETGAPVESTVNYYSETSGGAMETSVSGFAAQMGKTAQDPSAVAAVKTLIESDTMEIYFVEFPLFASISSTAQAVTDMAECITYMTPAASGQDMSATLKNAAAIAAAENGIISVSDAFAAYGEELGVKNTPEYAVFEAYSDTYKTLFSSTFAKARGTKNLNSASYQSLFKEAVVLTELSKAGGTDGIANVLNRFASYFDMTAYTASANKSAICLNIASAFEAGTVNNIADVQGILDTPIVAVPPVNVPSTPAGGGGGGGGRGGVPAPALPPIVEQPSKDAEEPVPSTDASRGFCDIEGYEWAEVAITDLAKSGIIAGMAEGVYAPGENLTRAQACAIICRLFAVGEKTPSVYNYGDVTEGDWHAGVVYAARDKGIVQGMSDDYFGAEENITRQDFVVMLDRAATVFNTPFGEIEETDEFADESEIAEYALESVKKFRGLSIVNGRDDGSFDPLGKITRAEAAKIAYNVKMIYEGR